MKFLSLEDELGLSVAVGVQPAVARAACSSMNDSDAHSRKTLIALGANREALVSLEAMGSYLRKQNPNDIGRSGVLFANIALEQVCASRNVALESLPIDAAAYDRSPGEAIKDGLQAVDGAKAQLLQTLRDNLTDLLVGLSTKRDALNMQISALWRQVADVERLAEIGEGQMYDQPVLRWDGYTKLCYSMKPDDNGLSPFDCASVVSDLCHFLTEHSHLYKRLIKKQIDWVNDHKGNLLKGKVQGQDGFAQYVFNPVEYQCNGMSQFGYTAQGHERGNAVVYRSAELPGMMAFFTYSADCKKFGLGGIEAFMASSGQVARFDPHRAEAFLSRINGTEPPDVNASPSERQALPLKELARLSLTECQARLQELKRGIRDLELWSDIAYGKLWKDAYFEQEVMAELLKTQASTHVEQSLRLLANAILVQLHQASEGVGQYVVETFTELLTYVQLSLTPRQETSHA